LAVRKILALFSVLAFAFALTVPALSGEQEAKEVQLTGWITDEYCGVKNANADGAGCARACAKKGSDMMLYSDGKLYKISDKDMALAHVGHEVVVTGTLSTDNLLTPKNIEKAEKS
jgi:hypothetical protein